MNFSPKNLKTKIIPNGFKGIFFGSIFLAALVSVGFFALSNAQAATGINEQISFQGKVVNSDGTNVTDGSYTFLFCLYTTGSPSSNCTTGSNNDAVWRESKSVTVTDGIFQTNLGDTTTLPGSVDFNTDNIYLGINFDADGQMSPLVRFTAAPYAMNAARVGGLTVTDTTGTLTIPNSETISFGGSFTTSASNDVTLTTTGATNVTLPTTGTLVTLDGVETLTNKTIGSTGLTFSGATTDITTASGEALTLNSGTTGTINIGTDASAETINIGNTGAAVKTIAIGNNTQANTITIGDASVTGLSLTDNNWSISASGAAAFASLSSSGAIAANGGITFDASTDTVGAFTAAGTIDMSTNILTNIGNTGTDFVASTGALTLAGVLTANGGISLSGSQSLAAAALSYIDLGLITHSSTANQGLRLPNAASATPSNPTSGEGYIAWDAAGNQLITYNGSAWTTVGGTSTLDGAYTSGNTITTDSGSNVVITLQEVVTPTSFVIENQDTAGVNAQRIFSSIASGTLTNGLLIEQTGAGTMTNGIQIAETAGTITDGILVTGTLGNILNSPSIDITGAGAITGATAITSSGTITFSGLSTAGIVTNTSGGVLGTTISVPIANGGTNATSIGSAGTIAYSTGTAYAFSAVGTAGQALISGGTGAPTFFAPTAGSIVFAGTSGILSQDNANFFWDDASNELGIGTATPGAPLDIYGTTNALRLSYDGSNYATLSSDSSGTLSLVSSNATESQNIIGAGAATDNSVAFDGASQDYYVGLDHTSGYFTIGTGFTVGSSTLFAVDSTGNVGIGTGVTAPGARLDLASSSTNTTADTTYGQRNTIADTGVVTTGTDTTYGNYLSLSRTLATGGTLNTYGNYSTLTNTFASGSGTINGYGDYITVTGNTNGTSTATGNYVQVTGADTNYGYAGVVTAVTSATSYGASLIVIDSTSGANTNYAADFNNTDAGVVTTGTDTTYGTRTTVSRTGATGGTINTYGLNMSITTDNAGAGTSTAYGALINTGTSGSTNADTVYGTRIETEANTGTTAYGLYVDSGAAAGTEYSGVFLNGNFGIGDATPDALLDVDFVQTSGTISGIAAPSSVTLAGSLIGQNIDLSSNITATGQSVAGSFIYLPAVTNTGASSYFYNGLVVTSGNLVQNTGAGTDTSRAFSATTPNITQTTGTVTADGFFVATGSITTGGTQRGINVSATGVGAGTLIGANISGITGGAGTETALAIGSGWDAFLDTASIDITGAGAITGATGVTSSGTITLSSIANDGAEATALLINGSNQVVSRELGTNAFTSTTYASAALSNLASVAINTSLLPGVNDSIDLGDDTHRFRDLYLGGETLHIGTSTTDEAVVSYTTSTNLLNFGTDSTSNGDIAFFSDDLYLDKSSSFIGVGDATPDALLDVDFVQTSGTISGIAAPSSVTLAGSLIGQNIDLSTNVTSTGQSVTGTSVALPSVTNTGGGTYDYRGLVVAGGGITQTTGSGNNSFTGLLVSNSDITQTTGSITATGFSSYLGTITTGGTQTGIGVYPEGFYSYNTGTVEGFRFGSITDGGATTSAIVIASGWDAFLDTDSIDITGAGAITGATGVATTTLTASSAIAANGGITFDASTDTVGAFTAAGTIDMSTNILTNIGNTGTDFVASTGALTLAGVLTANGGISLSGSQSLAAAALSYIDLGLITHSSTANQGLRLPNAASASPSNPTSGEGYIAWDAAGNQLITYNGSAWTTLSGGGGYNLIKDESTGLAAQTTLAFLGAGVSCADNVTQTECTISGGGSSDLQATYGADADGSNVTISLTAADDGLVFTNPTSGGNNLSTFLLQLDQANTTANMLALDVVQSSNASNAMNITANSIDGETGLAITTNGLTSGKGISITSSSTAFTGNLADISLTGSNAANTGNVLAVSNTGTANANTALFVDHRATGTGNLALRVNDESGDTTPFIIDGDGRVGIGTVAISDTASSERLLQVGSETKRGNSVTYGEVVTKGLKDITPLTDIKDVFLYDTTADSDGGRWIDWATTDRLSWYTEALDDGPNDPCDISTDDRCYAQHFPRKAILVVTGSALYIFDAINNVMWMKFDQNASGYALGADTNNNPSSVTALNGVIYVGAKGTASGGLYAFDFVNDRMWNYDATDRAGADVGISGRNAAVTYASDAKTALQLDPVGTSAEWMNINDVAAVSVNSGTSAVTINGTANLIPGNGESFVALATDSGVTIINLAAQKLLQYSDVTADNYESVALTKSGVMYALNSTSDQAEKWINIDSDKTSEVNGAYTSRWNSTVGPALAASTVAIQTDAPDALEVVERGSQAESIAAGNSDLIYVGHSLGLTEIHDHTTVTQGWSKFYTTTRQTMMMPNAIDAALPLDEASGTLAQDASFNNTDMSYKGTFTLGANGVRGKGVNLGNAGYLCSDANADGTCDNDTSFNSGTAAFNISMWFKHSTTLPATPDVLYEKCYNTTPAVTVGCVAMYMTTTGTVVGAIDATTTFTQFTTYDQMATSALTYNDDQWHFILMTRNNADDINVYIDGKPLNLSTATGQTATVDAASQVTSIGASCSAAANCATGTNFWDGSIDDFTFSSGATTVSNLLAAPARRLYNDARPLIGKKTITVTDATAATSTTLQETGSGWIPNEFAGLIVEITSDTGSGQSRRVIGNTTDTLTVSPAFDTTPDTTSDFEVDPESLYGASDIVTAIGITAESPLGEARMMCAGTNSASDTGGVTCYNHQAGPNVVAEVFHADAKKTDDFGDEWTGTDYDDIKSIDLSGRALIIGSMAHMYSRTEDVRLGQGLDYLANQLFNIKGEIIQDGILNTGSLGSEVGFTGGADLAENYYSDAPLEAGTVVALNKSRSVYVDPTNGSYQQDMLGVVATSPGIVLGDPLNNGYPIALVGRVPVKVTNENGQIYAGDRLTSASRSGFAMRAVQSGRVLGSTLVDAVDWAVCEGEDPADVNALLCTTVLVFVNLTDYSGQSVELAMAERDAAVGADGLSGSAEVDGALQGLGSDTGSIRLATSMPTKQEQILSFLKELHEKQLATSRQSSEVFTGRVSASTEVITPTLYVDQIFAKSIKADSIEGLSIWTNQLASLEQKYAGLQAETVQNGEVIDSAVTSEKALMNLEKFSVGSFSASLDASILGKLALGGGMTVGGDAEFAGNATFAKLAHFFGKTLFKGAVSFEQAPSFGGDTAGFAVIEKGAKKVRIVFDAPYDKQPIVTATLTNDASPLLSDADDALKQDIEVLEKEYLDSVFDKNIRYLVTEKSPRGFTLVLAEKAPRDLQFSWVALSVDKAKSFNSVKEDKGEEESPPEPTSASVPTDIPADTTVAPIVVPTETLEPISLPENIPTQ